MNDELVMQHLKQLIETLKPEPLQPHDTGLAVESLQSILRELFLYKNTVSGYFDTETERAICKLQKLLGLRENGVFDQETWQALNFWSESIASNDLSIS